MPTASLILPYAITEKSRKKKFSSSMELATILCLAEAGRKKRTMVGSSPERILFISKQHYPFWAVPWMSGCVIIDGLQILSPTLTYTVLPDLELFFNDIERGQTFREQFRNALDKHFKTFAGFVETKRMPMTAVVTDKAMLSDFSSYIEETIALQADVTGNLILVPPKLNENTAGESTRKVAELHGRVQLDVMGLEHAESTLNETMQFHEQKILREIELVNEAFKEEISRVKPTVEKKIDHLLKERDEKIEKVNKAAKAIINTKLREKEKRQRELERLEIDQTEFRRRLDVRRSRHDKVGVARWEHRLRISENKVSEAKERVHSLSRYIEKTSMKNQEDANKLKYGYQILIDRERKKFTDLEASRDSITKTKEQEKTRLQLMITHIVGLMKLMADQKRSQATELENLTIPWKPEHVCLLGVPFYLVGYKTEAKVRYGVFPPVKVIGSEGIIKKLEKKLLSFRLASRFRLLLQPRSNALNKMFNTIFEEELRADSAFEVSLRDLGKSNNLLKTSDFKEELTKGLEELKAEGWIKQEQCITLTKMYA